MTEHRVLATRITDPVAEKNAIKNLCAHAADPYRNSPSIDLTNSAPSSD